MVCPECGARGESELKVLDTRLVKDQPQRRRRYLCNRCGEKFTTLETYSHLEGRRREINQKISPTMIAHIQSIRDIANTLLVDMKLDE